MDLKHELAVGLSLFIAIAYIYVVLPSIYAEAGISFEEALIGVAFTITIGTLIASLLARVPLVIVPSIGIAAYSVSLASTKGLSWETLLAAVFLEGIVFIALSISRLREWFALGIPNSLKYGILAGVGLFLIFLGIRSRGML